jgi:hypothetical protein
MSELIKIHHEAYLGLLPAFSWFLAWLVFELEDGGGMPLRNVSCLLPDTRRYVPEDKRFELL